MSDHNDHSDTSNSPTDIVIHGDPFDMTPVLKAESNFVTVPKGTKFWHTSTSDQPKTDKTALYCMVDEIPWTMNNPTITHEITLTRDVDLFIGIDYFNEQEIPFPVNILSVHNKTNHTPELKVKFAEFDGWFTVADAGMIMEVCLFDPSTWTAEKYVDRSWRATIHIPIEVAEKNVNFHYQTRFIKYPKSTVALKKTTDVDLYADED